HGAIALARRAPQHSASSTRERRPRAVRVLHDLGSENDAGLAEWTRPVRRAGGGRRLGGAVQAFPNERSIVVARGLLAPGSTDRPAATRPPVHMGLSSRSPHPHERKNERRTP